MNWIFSVASIDFLKIKQVKLTMYVSAINTENKYFFRFRVFIPKIYQEKASFASTIVQVFFSICKILSWNVYFVLAGWPKKMANFSKKHFQVEVPLLHGFLGFVGFQVGNYH